jgi:hypothetical protein
MIKYDVMKNGELQAEEAWLASTARAMTPEAAIAASDLMDPGKGS